MLKVTGKVRAEPVSKPSSPALASLPLEQSRGQALGLETPGKGPGQLGPHTYGTRLQ